MGLRIASEAVNLGTMDGADHERSDDELMVAYATGDPQAFEVLYRRHKNVLYGYIYRHAQDRALTDELFQDVWQNVIKARANYEPQGHFLAWIMRIAQHRLDDYWRAKSHRPNAPTDSETRIAALSDERTPETEATAFGQRRALRMALSELPDEQRTVLLLRLEQELTLEQIAEVTGTSRETVKSRLRYAMDKLRQRLQA